MRKILFVLAIVASSIAAHAQRTNVRYADQFYNNGVNPDVGSMVAAAQAACPSSQTCIVEIDATLNSWPAGTMPTRCALCTWVDWRTPNAVVFSGMSNQTFNGVLFANAFSGADFGVKVNACIAAVLALGGGVCDARGLTGSQDINSEIDVGTRTGTSVVLLLSNNLSATVHLSDGVSCGFKVFDKSSLIGLGTAGASKAIIFTATGANMDSLVCTDDAPTAGGSYVRIEGIEVFNDISTTGTFANGLLNVQHLFDGSTVSSIFVRGGGVRGLYVHDVCCGATFTNVVANGFGQANAEPCVIGKNAEHTGGTFIGLSCTHAGDTKSELNIQDVGGTTYTDLYFYGTYVECNTTDTVTPLVQINSGATGTVRMDGLTNAGPSCAGSTTAYLVDIAASVKGVILTNIRRGSTLVNSINDHVANKTVTDSYLPTWTCCSNSDYLHSVTIVQTLKVGSGTTLMSSTAPTINVHFNTSGDTILANGTMAIKIVVGTGVAGSTGSLTLPAATNGWACHLFNQTRGAYIQQTAFTTTGATFTNYGTTVGTPVNWTNSDVLVGGCTAF